MQIKKTQNVNEKGLWRLCCCLTKDFLIYYILCCCITLDDKYEMCCIYTEFVITSSKAWTGIVAEWVNSFDFQKYPLTNICIYSFRTLCLTCCTYSISCHTIIQYCSHTALPRFRGHSIFCCSIQHTSLIFYYCCTMCTNDYTYFKLSINHFAPYEN